MSQCGHQCVLLLCCSLLLALGVCPVGADGPPPRTSLVTVEGVILEIGTVAGEGGIEVVLVIVAGEDDPENPLQILLAPTEVMKSIGFTVAAGDQLKIKYFSDEKGTLKAHKVHNISQGLMVRLRTLRQIPLWDNQGCWQGGPGRMRHGQGPRIAPSFP